MARGHTAIARAACAMVSQARDAAEVLNKAEASLPVHSCTDQSRQTLEAAAGRFMGSYK